MVRVAIFIIVLALCVFPASGAGMARIINVVDSHTIVVEQQGARSTLNLAGVSVPPPDEARAAGFLRQITASGWVLVEHDGSRPGEAWLYRSPDGLFVNGEMTRGAYRSDGTPMTWLGESDPGPRHEAAPARKTTARPRAVPRPHTPRRIRR